MLSLRLTGVYDDPWNVDAVQQEILDQLEQKQRQRSTSGGGTGGGVSTGGSIKHRSSQSNNDTTQSNRMHKRYVVYARCRSCVFPSESPIYANLLVFYPCVT